MSRHKNLKNMIDDAYIGEEGYYDETGEKEFYGYGDEYGEEEYYDDTVISSKKKKGKKDANTMQYEENLGDPEDDPELEGMDPDMRAAILESKKDMIKPIKAKKK